MNNCDKILEIIEKNAGKQYKSPSKISDATRSQKMKDLYSECENGELLFEKLVSVIATECNMICIYHKSVLDGSRAKIRRYYWSELIDEKYDSSPESISIFAENMDGVVRYRVSTELNERRATEQALEKHNLLVSFPCEKGVLFGLNDGIARDIFFTDNPKEAKMKLSAEYKKVQMCVVVQRDKKLDDKDYVDLLIDAVRKLERVYKKLA